MECVCGRYAHLVSYLYIYIHVCMYDAFLKPHLEKVYI